MESTRRNMLNLNEIEKSKIPNIDERRVIAEKLKEIAKEVLGGEVKLYNEPSGLSAVILEDFRQKNEKMKYIGSLDDVDIEMYVEKNSKPTTKEEEFRFEPKIANSVFHYPEFNVVVANIFVQVFGSYERYEFVYSSSEDGIINFFEYVNKRLRTTKKITVFTDTSNGVYRSTEELNGTINREDVILEENVKTQIFRSIDEFFKENQDFYAKYEIPHKRGILLHGEPGNGKTTLVKAIAKSINAPVAYWQITEYTNSASIKEVFERVYNMAPIVLVIEDMDSMPDTARSAFLNTLDGATSKEGIFLIGTTNYPEKIDPALMNRAGRFDRSYKIPLPDRDMRLKFLKQRNFDFLLEEEIEAIADMTDDFSIVQLREVHSMCALQYHYENKVDFKMVIAEMKDSLTKQKKGNWDKKEEKVGFN